MEVPQTVKERFGSSGESIFKQGHKAGKLDGAKVAQDPFAVEANQMANAVVKGKAKEGYKPPTPEELGNLFSQVFKYGKVPDRSGIKKLTQKALQTLEGMPKSAPKPKTTPPS